MMTGNLQRREEGLVNVSNRSLTKGEREANKGRIIELLNETGNKNVINELIPALNKTTFYTKARCNSHHNNYDGALAQHSLGVCFNALDLAGNTIDRSKVILAALLHDLCNVKNFCDKGGNPVHAANGHGFRSRDILEKLNLGLDKDVLDVIRYHLGPKKRFGDKKRELSHIWASPLFSVLHVADHMDAGFVHCDTIGIIGAESYISLDCSELHNLQEFKQIKYSIEQMASKYNIQFKQNKYRNIDWNKTKCSLRLLEFGNKPWGDLIPLTGVCRQIAKETKKCSITVSKISISKNNLLLDVELDPSLISLRNQLQEQIKRLGYDNSFTKNLTIKIAEISNTTGDTAKFLADLNQYVNHYTFDVDAINLHYFKGIVAGVYYFK